MENAKGTGPKAAALVFPPGTRAFKITGDEMEPEYHAGEVLFIAPDEDGKYAAVQDGRGRIVGKLVRVLRDVGR